MKRLPTPDLKHVRNYRWCGALIIAVRTCMASYVCESRAKIPLMYMASRTDLAELGPVIIMPVADESHAPQVQLIFLLRFVAEWHASQRL